MEARQPHVRGTSNSAVRGSAESRRRRKVWLLSKFGDSYTAPCAFCGFEVDYHTITVDRFPIAGHEGGRYIRGNIRPACGPCNSRDGAAIANLKRGLTPSQASVKLVETTR